MDDHPIPVIVVPVGTTFAIKALINQQGTGTPITQSSLLSIAYQVWDRTSRLQVGSGSIVIANAIYNTVQTNDTRFPNGFNFAWACPNGVPWLATTAYTAGQYIKANGNEYVCTVGGISSNSGTGPSGTGTGITDGTVTWNYHPSVVPAPGKTNRFLLQFLCTDGSAFDIVQDCQCETLQGPPGT